MGNKVYYFGYGANRDLAMMTAITGKENLLGKPGVLKGYTLCVQKLGQIPDNILPTSPVQVSPRTIIEEGWPETFESYIIKPDPEGEVQGTIWELDPQDRALVREWELIDFGWYQDIKTKATAEDGTEIEIETEGLREGQQVDREVDGKNYETWLNRPEDFAKVAVRAREEYLERIESQKDPPLTGEQKG